MHAAHRPFTEEASDENSDALGNEAEHGPGVRQVFVGNLAYNTS
jgi:hypothetical protein